MEILLINLIQWVSFNSCPWALLHPSSSASCIGPLTETAAQCRFPANWWPPAESHPPQLRGLSFTNQQRSHKLSEVILISTSYAPLSYSVSCNSEGFQSLRLPLAPNKTRSLIGSFPIWLKISKQLKWCEPGLIIGCIAWRLFWNSSRTHLGDYGLTNLADFFTAGTAQMWIKFGT